MNSIEWFNQQLVDRQNGKCDPRSWDEIFKQAKEMHEKELSERYMKGYEAGILYDSEND